MATENYFKKSSKNCLQKIILLLIYHTQKPNRTTLQNSDRVYKIVLMNKTKMKYFKDDDIIYVNISDSMEINSVELSPNITAEIDENGELIGIEILNASTFVRDSIR